MTYTSSSLARSARAVAASLNRNASAQTLAGRCLVVAPIFNAKNHGAAGADVALEIHDAARGVTTGKIPMAPAVVDLAVAVGWFMRTGRLLLRPDARPVLEPGQIEALSLARLA